jgi:outer membrane receptor protein involved in Fe transport
VRLLPRYSLAFLVGGVSAFAQSAPPQTAPTLLSKVEVTASSDQAQLNTIDRKVYSVGKDLQSVAGSAADVLQNIPSVQVDVDGNVSLRGDPGVQILIDGHTSGLMGTASRADVLSQLPADSIERIEVITAPSARYKPDGTAGIINIVLKKKHPAGLSGNVRLTVGNDRRYGTALSAGYNPGRFSFSGLLNYRQDDRVRIFTDNRSYIDPSTGARATTQTYTREHVRPEFKIANIEAKFQATPFDSLRETLDYMDRSLHRYSDEREDSEVGGTEGLYNRLRDDPENERDAESTTAYEHEFGRSDNTLSAEFRWEHYTEIENNHYTDIFSVPPGPPELDTTKIFTNEPSTEASLEYSNTLSDKTTVEAGFDRSEDISRQNHEGAVYDPATGQWENDPTITNDFDLDQVVTALYGTYRHAYGHLGAMLGLRLESAAVETEQVTSAINADQRYLRIYPTLHLKYDLSDTQQLQLNYSHRVHRPESEDLNPFPEYQDPYNLRAGNPYLRPEEAHSLEAGYQYKEDDTTYLATLYYKYSYDGFTTFSQFVNSTTLLTTEENLSKSQSGGLELAATAKPAAKLSVNASANLFYNEIDASNLGYSTSISTFAWAGKLSAQYSFSDRTLLQFNCNYTAKRLTPQGYRLPTFVANIGIKHELKNRKMTLVLTVSDLLDTLKDETRLDTPTLRDDAIRRRNSRILYVGVVYSFGGSKKKKDDALQFDDNP